MIYYLFLSQLLVFAVELIALWRNRNHKTNFHILMFIFLWIGFIVAFACIKVHQFFLEEYVNIDTGTISIAVLAFALHVVLAPFIGLIFFKKKKIY